MKQTAVEWLQNELFTEEYMRNNLFEIFEQAIEMEKQQIIDAHGDDRSYLQDDGSHKTINGEQYYNETYKPSA